MRTSIPLEKLPQLLAEIKRAAQRAISDGAVAAAKRGRGHLARQTPIDQRDMKRAWAAFGPVTKEILARIENDAPHAGVIERGARPHGVSEEGEERIRQWVRRKILRGVRAHTFSRGKNKGQTVFRRFAKGKRDPEVERVVGAIIHKLQIEGQKGTFFVERAVPLIAQWAGKAIIRSLRKELAGIRV